MEDPLPSPALRRQHAHRAGEHSFLKGALLFVDVHFVRSGLCSSRVVILQHGGIIETSIGVLDGVIVQQLVNIAKAVAAMHTPNMKKVINGTGTILHTNLGRAPISYEHMMKAAEIVSGYSNLEYNLEAGRRGERYSHFEKLLCKLTGAEAAMAVNNNASSVLLILSQTAQLVAYRLV